jgi:hypothetical protein
MTPDAPPVGLRALVINPTGSTHLKRLPANTVQAAHLIAELVGGNLEAIFGPAPQGSRAAPWIGYVDADFTRNGKAPNPTANTLARQLGWKTSPADYLCGTVVFLGRDGADEVDAPDYLMREAGVAPPRMIP